MTPKGFRTIVFAILAIGLALGAVLALTRFGDPFFVWVSAVNAGTVGFFGKALAGLAALCVLGAIAAYATGIGDAKIGGADAAPLMSRWSWFSIALAMTTTVGLLFWGCAEPLFHMHSPPASFAIAPGGRYAANFAISAAYLHWTLTPYAIFAVTAIISGLTYWRDGGGHFSTGPILQAALGGNARGSFVQFIDGLAALGLAFTLCGSLAAGLLALTRAASEIFLIPESSGLLGSITLLVTFAFIMSSVLGLLLGIRNLSNIHAVFFLIVLFSMLFAGPTGSILYRGAVGLKTFLISFPLRSFLIGFNDDDIWPRLWTVGNWLNVFAWAPIAGIFMGYISRGRKVSDMVIVIGLFPALAAVGWIAVFGVSALMIDAQSGGALYADVARTGPAAAVFAVFHSAPLRVLMLFGFVALMFTSLAAVADTSAFSIGRLAAPFGSATPSARAALVTATGSAFSLIAWLAALFGGAERLQGLATMLGLVGAIVTAAALLALLRFMVAPRKAR